MVASVTEERPDAALVVGTRGSTLALWQTHWVLDRLHALQPDVLARVETIRTQGDRTQAKNVPLNALGDKGLFVAELEQALLADRLDVAVQPMQDRALVEHERHHARADVAVHSLKDLPSTLTPGLALVAVPERADPRDVLVSRHGLCLADLPQGASVATGSLRRRAQLLHMRPDLRIVEVRGNVDTRLRKAMAPDGPDAMVLAAAGLQRLGLDEYITEFLPVDVLVPAVGQGALAVEVRAHDRRALRLLRPLDHAPTRNAVVAERAVLATLGGGCQVPVGAHAFPLEDGRTLRLIAVVASPDGRTLLRAEREGMRPATLGKQVARELLAAGASDILREIAAQTSDEGA